MGDDGSGFETFEDNVQAYRAGYTIMNTYNSEYFNYNMTIRDLITRWAPPSENDT